jgi:hypothetical protein
MAAKKCKQNLRALAVILFLMPGLWACEGHSWRSAGLSRRTPPTTQDQTIQDQLQPTVIYGDDDRVDLFQVTRPEVLANAKSTVALIDQSKLLPAARGAVRLDTKRFATEYGLCPSERFGEQGTVAFCSGFLVGPQTVVTAGHCVRNQTRCDSVRFVFDFHIAEPNGQTPQVLPSEKVFSCRRLVASQVVSGGADYSVIELDRPVVDRPPLRLRRSGQVALQTPLYVAGHPSGIPLKVAGGAGVRSQGSGFFVANLDTYGGNSGSPVFNDSTGEVEGILVRGETDYVVQGTCRVSKRCDNGQCRGEDVTRIAETLPFLSGGGGGGAGRRAPIDRWLERRWLNLP